MSSKANRGPVALTAVLMTAALFRAAPVDAADRRVLWIHNTHLDEQLLVTPFGQHGVPRWIAWRRLDRLFRSHRTHEVRSVNPRLLRVLAQIQRHFDGRRIELLSGYRSPEDRERLSSYHQVGRAADIYIQGVAARDLFDYCRELGDVGCGLYPKGMHVHVDVRSVPGVWVDLSHYGDGADYVRDARRWLIEHPDAGRSRTVVPRRTAPARHHGNATRHVLSSKSGAVKHIVIDFVITKIKYPRCAGPGRKSKWGGSEAARRRPHDVAIAGPHDGAALRGVSRSLRS